MAYLAVQDEPEVIARAGVGPNAGHTVRVNGEDYGLRQIPCGFPHEEAELAIGPGVLVNPEVLLDEVERLSRFRVDDRLIVDERCAIIEPKHIEAERASKHLSDEIDTTGTGCGRRTRTGRCGRRSWPGTSTSFRSSSATFPGW